MRYRYMLPSDRLSEYVDYYFIIEKESSQNGLPVEVFPAPQAEMVFTFGEERSSYCVVGKDDKHLSADYAVSGFFTKKATYRNDHKLGVLMVGFKPWGIQPFIDFSISEITNQNLDLRNIFPSKVRTLQDELRTAQTDECRVMVVEKFLLSILRSHNTDQLVTDAVKQISQFNGQVPVRDLAERFHLCEKQFKRRFVRTVGITPKLFSRLSRFQHILNLMDNAHVKPLDTAIEAGFYDESHFIREFEEFTNTSPKKYLQNNLKTELRSYFDDQVKKSVFYNTIYK